MKICWHVPILELTEACVIFEFSRQEILEEAKELSAAKYFDQARMPLSASANALPIPSCAMSPAE